MACCSVCNSVNCTTAALALHAQAAPRTPESLRRVRAQPFAPVCGGSRLSAASGRWGHCGDAGALPPPSSSARPRMRAPRAAAWRVLTVVVAALGCAAPAWGGRALQAAGEAAAAPFSLVLAPAYAAEMPYGCLEACGDAPGARHHASRTRPGSCLRASAVAGTYPSPPRCAGTGCQPGTDFLPSNFQLVVFSKLCSNTPQSQVGEGGERGPGGRARGRRRVAASCAAPLLYISATPHWRDPPPPPTHPQWTLSSSVSTMVNVGSGKCLIAGFANPATGASMIVAGPCLACECERRAALLDAWHRCCCCFKPLHSLNPPPLAPSPPRPTAASPPPPPTCAPPQRRPRGPSLARTA